MGLLILFPHSSNITIKHFSNLPVYLTLPAPRTTQIAHIIKNTKSQSIQHISKITAPSHPSQLLELLHEMIAAQQTYPESAILLKQSGTVKIAFVLFPDGHLENIRKLSSSGIKSIDEAALNAVQAISPVAIAQKYLGKPEELAVDIIFSLSS